MPDIDFAQWFRGLTACEPYQYQIAYAMSPEPFDLLNVPTGAGKTATAVLGWLWRRRFAVEPIRRATPRRLVYCLPMRVLVEQTFDCAVRWLEKAGLKDEVSVHKLLGGEAPDEWFLQPERDAVLIGTQDMLLSRALNRGYAESRFHWPIDFGLLNNDCLWIFDEVQLMGVGLGTAAQLAVFRRSDKLGSIGPNRSVWMSATMDRDWLNTVDFAGSVPGLAQLALDDADLQSETLAKRMTARKSLSGPALAAGGKDYPAALAKAIRKQHDPDGQTLVVLNTVERAKQVFEALRKAKDAPPLLLIHSRFRPAERKLLNDRLTDKNAIEGRIVVATQVVEAGVDVSSRVLFTELAPWPSLVQRFGRCNRFGEHVEAKVFWVDLAEEKLAAPYASAELVDARGRLAELEGRTVSPDALREFRKDEKLKAPEFAHVLRRRDLVELFDTAPDLSGNDVDVSRFIREGDDRDVQVFWRDWPAPKGYESPPDNLPRPSREELCSAPLNKELRAFLKSRTGWVWDHLDGCWRKVEDDALRPGLVVLLHASAGGYDWDSENDSGGSGWNPESKKRVKDLTQTTEPDERVDGDSNVLIGRWLTIEQHTDDVCRMLETLLPELRSALPADWLASLRIAARWHDAGKSHKTFQEAMQKLGCPDPAALWAKSGVKGRTEYDRPKFRHELASALLMLQTDKPFLAAYLAGAHHGRVRLAVRSLPGEKSPENPKDRFALGVWDGDDLPAVSLGNGEIAPRVEKLNLSVLALGDDSDAPSWLRQALRLRDDPGLGPFRLAYLEALLRAADVRASKAESEGRMP